MPTLVAVQDQAGNTATLGSGQVTTFAVDNTKPSVNLSYLIDGATYVAAPRAVRGADGGMTVRATFTNTASLGPTPTLTIASTQFSVPVGPQAMNPTADPLVWEYRQAVPTSGDGTITLTVNGADPAGNTVTETNEFMRVDNSLPYVTSITRV